MRLAPDETTWLVWKIAHVELEMTRLDSVWEIEERRRIAFCDYWPRRRGAA